MKMIDAELFINLELYDAEREEWYTERMTIEECLDRYADEGCPPTIDAVEVVRCKDCKYRYMSDLKVWECTFGLMIIPNGFCNYGEEAENDND